MLLIYVVLYFFFFKQKTAYEMLRSLVGSEMCIRDSFEAVKKAASSGKYDMLILDEINVAVDFKLIPVEDLIDFIKNKPPARDLVLTGRYAPRALVKLADTVSEVKEIRHHYAAGIKDRAGIEY